MPTYLLTWKPTRSLWADLEREINRLRNTGSVAIRWSAGLNKHIAVGDRVFFLRQGGDKAGIIGAGSVTKGSHLGQHWDPERSREKSIFVKVKADSLLHPERDRILRKSHSASLRQRFGERKRQA